MSWADLVGGDPDPYADDGGLWGWWTPGRLAGLALALGLVAGLLTN